MMEAGAESLTFSLIPPALDQVFVGNMDLSRMYGTSCTFVLGQTTAFCRRAQMKTECCRMMTGNG